MIRWRSYQGVEEAGSVCEALALHCICWVCQYSISSRNGIKTPDLPGQPFLARCHCAASSNIKYAPSSARSWLGGLLPCAAHQAGAAFAPFFSIFFRWSPCGAEEKKMMYCSPGTFDSAANMWFDMNGFYSNNDGEGFQHRKIPDEQVHHVVA